MNGPDIAVGMPAAERADLTYRTMGGLSKLAISRLLN
jgi:hypothetical protein